MTATRDSEAVLLSQIYALILSWPDKGIELQSLEESADEDNKDGAFCDKDHAIRRQRKNDEDCRDQNGS